jgi:hypothetical protein
MKEKYRTMKKQKTADHKDKGNNTTTKKIQRLTKGCHRLPYLLSLS